MEGGLGMADRGQEISGANHSCKIDFLPFSIESATLLIFRQKMAREWLIPIW